MQEVPFAVTQLTTCDRVATTAGNQNALAQDVFEEMDRELGVLLRSDVTVVGPLKGLPGWGGPEVLRRGLGQHGSLTGLPVRASQDPGGSARRPLHAADTPHLQWASVQGATTSAARPALPRSPPVGSCLARLLQTVQSLHDAGDFFVARPSSTRPGLPVERPSRTDAPAPSEGWRPRARACPATASATPAARVGSAGDEALAMQLQFAPEERPEAAELAPISLDEALALALCMGEGAPESEGRFRAEARQRVQARRSRERATEFASWGVSSPSSQTEQGTGGSFEDSDGFYARLWGLDGNSVSLADNHGVHQRRFKPRGRCTVLGYGK